MKLETFNQFFIQWKSQMNLAKGIHLGNSLLGLLIFWQLSILTAKVIEFELLEEPAAPTIQKRKLRPQAEAGKSLSQFSAILKDNLFGVEAGSFTTAKKMPAQYQPSQNLKQLVANYSLKGFFFGMAIILDKKSGKEEVYGSGDPLGAVKIGQIASEAGYVEVLQGSNRTKLVLVEDSPSTAPTRAPLAAKRTKKSKKAKSNAKVVQQGNDFFLRSEELDQELNNFTKLLNQARVVPHTKDGKFVGYQIRAIDKGSLYEKLGLKNGDIIREINGDPIDSPEKAMNLFKVLRNEKEFMLNLDRGGNDTHLNYHIQ